MTILRKARHWVMATGVMLAGCASGVDEDLYGGISYRDPSAPIGVSTRYDYARMQGLWFVRRLTPDDLAPLRMVFYKSENDGDGANEVRGSCADEAECEPGIYQYVIDDTSKGALSLFRNGPGAGREFVVFWVDEGHRTMAVGAPNGRYAWVLDRQSDGGEDRIAAALEILEFYGFDTAAMRAKRRERLQ